MSGEVGVVMKILAKNFEILDPPLLANILANMQ
jgi:hypothetical protein